MAKGQTSEVVVWTKSGCPAIATKGAKSIPQIFINGEHIGGFDDLQNLQKRDELNYKLGLVSELPKKSIADKIKNAIGFN